MGKGASIRLAVEADQEALLELDRELPLSSSHASLIKRSIAHGACWLIFDGDLVGYGIIEHSFFERAFLEMLYIRKSKRRAGLGFNLFQHLEFQARTEKVFTSTNLSNTVMHSFLQKAGYQMCGTVFELDEGDPELFFFKRIKG